MPFDPSLDKEVFKEIKEFEETRISVGVFSYNNGAKKLQMTRENLSPDGEWRFTKLGRMTKDETREIIPIMMKALENM